ncbi:hypothetical protein K439DRAFT_1623115 [Ramaria rubella]|nr:hypothetical protein K439DRAFT_1623115 [Ramaria rubella]
MWAFLVSIHQHSGIRRSKLAKLRSFEGTVLPLHIPPALSSPSSGTSVLHHFKGFFLAFSCLLHSPARSLYILPYCLTLLSSELLFPSPYPCICCFVTDNFAFLVYFADFHKCKCTTFFGNPSTPEHDCHEECAREHEQRQMTSTTNRMSVQLTLGCCTSLPLPLTHFLTWHYNNLRGILVIHLSSLLWLPIFPIPSLLIQVLEIKWLIYVLS